MASLVVISSLFQFLLAARLSLLRRIFTPVVSGTVITLIAATVMPIVFDTLGQVPEGVSGAAGPLAAGSTLIVVTALVLRGPPAWRLWAPVIGIVVGCAVGVPFGLYDIDQVLEAPWVGVPIDSWPGFDFTPGVHFWALLPAFVVVTLVGAIEVTARKQGSGAELEFVSAAEGDNLEDQLAHLAEPADVPDGREISFRLLRHYASSVRHQKYHEVDIVTVHVESRR